MDSKWLAITLMTAAICLTIYLCVRPAPTDPLAQRLREASTVVVQQQVIDAYYKDTLKINR